MGKKRRVRTEITIETTRVFVAGGGGSQVRAWCERCGDEARMVTVDQAAAVTRVNSAAVRDRIEAGQVHSGETPEGLRLICLNCLLRSI